MPVGSSKGAISVPKGCTTGLRCRLCPFITDDQRNERIKKFQGSSHHGYLARENILRFWYRLTNMYNKYLSFIRDRPLLETGCKI